MIKKKDWKELHTIWTPVLKWEGLSSASTQAATQQDQLSSPATALFSVGFFRQRFGNYCPTSTWWTGSGTHSSGKHSSSWQPTTPVGEAAVVKPAWQSMLHTLTLALPSLSLFLYVSFSVLPFHNLPGREMRKWGEKKEKQQSVSPVSPLLSVSLSSVSLPCPPSSPLLAAVSGMSWPCARGVPAPSVSSQLNLLILLPHAALLHSERNKSAHVKLAYTQGCTYPHRNPIM